MSIAEPHKLSAVEKLRIIEVLWGDLAGDEDNLSNPSWHETELIETEKNFFPATSKHWIGNKQRKNCVQPRLKINLAAFHFLRLTKYRLHCYQYLIAFALMKAKHLKTLHSVFALPTRASIVFAELEALLIALGAEKTEREGSRVKFTLQGMEWHAHRPHPGKDAKKYQVEQLREMLSKLEIKP